MTATNSPAARLLAAMAASPNSTQAALALAAGCARSTASVALAKLVADGEAVRTEALGKGAATYRVAAPATSAAVCVGTGDCEGYLTDGSVCDEHMVAAAAQEDAEVMAAEAAAAAEPAATEYLVRTPAGLDYGRDADLAACKRSADSLGAGALVERLDENLCRTGDVVYRVASPEAPEGGAAIPTAADMTAGLTRGTWKQLGVKLGDTVEVLTPNQERLTGWLGASSGVCFLVVGDRQVSLGGWATKQHARLVAQHIAPVQSTDRPGPRTEAKARKAAEKKAAAPAAPAEPQSDGTEVLVAAVKAHAQKHYTAGGWDVVVECWSDEQIAEVLREDGARNVHAALASFRALADGWAEREADAMIEGATEAGQAEEALATRREANRAALADERAASKAAVVDGRKLGRDHYVPRGGLKAMVWAWYAANPGVAMTPHKMAKAIGAKAPGAVLDQQRNAVKAGYAVQHEAPLRFEWLAGVECPAEQAEMAASIGFVPERLES